MRALLQDAELELHRFAAHHVAQIVFPKAAIARKCIDEQLESQPSPECKYLDADGNLLKFRFGVIAEAAVVFAEVAEAEAVQVALVRRIAERAEVGVVRR